ncbi:HAMP domain-containing histidine kinase [Streptomyces actuosus]|uniref:histidine kinase n=1 Tax=Streptomyces actuosus TaxID=1885 RepID=A0ABS2VZK6_STRAS|nr:HAMP domain-containing sensor histidine kinase [Streptomyces actuosus]MBN0048581.1 HAMP domain-containing histidine kinase [Streptomyces actuosus]
MKPREPLAAATSVRRTHAAQSTVLLSGRLPHHGGPQTAGQAGVVARPGGRRVPSPASAHAGTPATLHWAASDDVVPGTPVGDSSRRYDDGTPRPPVARDRHGTVARTAHTASPRSASPMALELTLVLVPLLASLWLAARVRRERNSRRRSEQRLLEFLATVGHELRTPLTAISGYVSLARMGGLADTDKFDLAMSRMTDETRRMSALLDELVLLARLDLGQPLHREPVNLARLCRDAVTDAQASSASHPIQLTILPGQYTVLGDRDRLYQVVANLLANVRHHTPEGTRTVLGLGNEDGHRVIEVIDNGPGVPPQLRDSAFDRFVHGGKPTAPAPKEEGGGGNGLGLSVAAAIIGAHGGTLTLEPSVRGAWFRVRLPA